MGNIRDAPHGKDVERINTALDDRLAGTSDTTCRAPLPAIKGGYLVHEVVGHLTLLGRQNAMRGDAADHATTPPSTSG